MKHGLSAARLCKDFNAKHPVGSTFEYRSYPKALPVAVTTRTEAEVLEGHTAVVWVNEMAGCVALHALRHVERAPAILSAGHTPDCGFRLAETGAAAIECKHGYDCCPICDPCTCGAAAPSSTPTGDTK